MPQNLKISLRNLLRNRSKVFCSYNQRNPYKFFKYAAMKKMLLYTALCLALSIFSQAKAEADSWWGDDARSSEWVLSHGGTIIKYKIIAKGGENGYKAILYENGKVVEWENGKTGKFDDPKNSTYVVKAFKGGVEQKKTSKGGKEILSSGPIVAHPGETIFVVLDDLADKVTITSNRHAIAAKKAAEKDVIENEKQNVPTQKEIVPEIEKVQAFNFSDIGKACINDPLLPEFDYDQNGLITQIGLPTIKR